MRIRKRAGTVTFGVLLAFVVAGVGVACILGGQSVKAVADDDVVAARQLKEAPAQPDAPDDMKIVDGVVEYPVTGNGYTYGCQMDVDGDGEFDATPDMIYICANNGQMGYIFWSDYEKMLEIPTPNEECSWEDIRAGNYDDRVPVYASDGTTVVGLYGQGPASYVVITTSWGEFTGTAPEAAEYLKSIDEADVRSIICTYD